MAQPGNESMCLPWKAVSVTEPLKLGGDRCQLSTYYLSASNLPFSRCSVVTYGISLGISSLLWSWQQAFSVVGGVGTLQTKQFYIFLAAVLEKSRGCSSVWMWKDLVKLCSRMWWILSDARASHWQWPLFDPLWIETCTLQTSHPQIPVGLLFSQTPRFALQVSTTPDVPVSQLPKPSTCPYHWLLILHLHSRESCLLLGK